MNLKLMSVPRPAPAAAIRLMEWQSQLYHETRSAPRPLRELTPRLLERRNLDAAWERVSSTDGAETPGPDGVRCGDLKQRLPAWLAALADDLFRGRYQPQPPRWFSVPKPGKPGKERRIGILNVRDRVVQAAVKQLLEPIFDPLFLPCSYGFRPGHSVAAALADAVRRLDGHADDATPFVYAVHLDVADCFDSIDHTLLLAELRRTLADDDLLRMLERILLIGGAQVGRLWWKRTCGLVQGSSLSPLLCNLALHPLDLALRDAADSFGYQTRPIEGKLATDEHR